MKVFLFLYLVSTVILVSFIGFLVSMQSAISFAAGALLIFTNLVVLAWAWSLIFRKKFVALATLAIVIKYAILGLIIYVLIQDERILVEWMAAGLSMLLPSILAYAFVHHKLN